MQTNWVWTFGLPSILHRAGRLSDAPIYCPEAVQLMVSHMFALWTFEISPSCVATSFNSWSDKIQGIQARGRSWQIWTHLQNTCAIPAVPWPAWAVAWKASQRRQMSKIGPLTAPWAACQWSVLRREIQLWRSKFYIVLLFQSGTMNFWVQHLCTQPFKFLLSSKKKFTIYRYWYRLIHARRGKKAVWFRFIVLQITYPFQDALLNGFHFEFSEGGRHCGTTPSISHI